jgi:hypothetical protein
MNGSGTTMLLDSLGRHSELYAYPHETRLIPHLLRQEKQFGELTNDSNFEKLWFSVLAIPAFQRRTLTLPENWRDAQRTTAGVLDHVFSTIARSQNKSRWCEKTPMHVQHMPLLAEAFPDARFIHMIRDGRDCAASFHRRWSRTPVLTIQRWKNAVRKGRRDGEALGPRYMELHYEALTDNPREQLQHVCSFLGIEFEEVILESSQPYLKGGWHNMEIGTIKRNSRSWREYFSTAQIAELESISGKELSACGYYCDDDDGDRNLPARKRKLLMLRDQVRQFLQEVYMKATGKLERPWRQILAKPLAALKQQGSSEG